MKQSNAPAEPATTSSPSAETGSGRPNGGEPSDGAASAVPSLDLRNARPPAAEKRIERSVVHGETREDAYFWMREKTDPAVMAHLRAEQAYTDAVMAPTESLQRELYDEMLSHIKQTDLSVPYRFGAYWYYSRTEEGMQYPTLARKRGSLDAPEEITLDLNELARGHEYLGIGAYEISDDGNLLAYSIDTTGYRQYTMHVKDLRTGEHSSEKIERVGSIAWASDNATLYYTTEDDVSKRHDTFWKHRLGDASSTVLFEETDDRYDVGAGRTNDRAYVLVASYSKATTEWQALRVDRPGGELAVIEPRADGHRYSVEHHGGDFYIVTNLEAVENRIVVAPDASPGRAHWREIVAERDDVHIDSLDMFESHGIVRIRKGGIENLEILDLASNALRAVDFPDAVHAIGAQQNPEFHTQTYRFSYTSLVTPNSVYELDMRDGSRTLLKETEVPGFDPRAYATELRYATARDGTRVPISLVYRANVPRDGSAPMLLYGYGSYGISIDPTFSAPRLVLLDRGAIFAIAHIRGGGELGERWRTAGHLDRKITTFEDFIDCAEFAIAERYTSADRLVIQGGSAGGLLVGAVANMRPDLFRAAIAQVPFVDVVNTMLDASLPLTTGEYLEWGNPTIPADYDYMMRYSPYDNVAAQPYPTMLFKVSVNDSQVPYWEGAKIVARLREAATGDRPILLATNFGAGHGGASGRYDALKETAFNYAFVLAETLGT